MTMHLFTAGELIRDPERKTSSNGNAYVSALLRVDPETVVSLTAFDTTLAASLAGLKKGSALVPSLRKHYPDSFNCAVIASAANLGPVIPPSNAMIVYALMAGSSVSVGGLFMAGIVPGVLLALGGWVYDESLLATLARRPGAVLITDDGQAVAAHVPAERVAEASAALERGADPGGLQRLSLAELAYNEALRKREPPVLVRLTSDNVRAVEARTCSPPS